MWCHLHVDPKVSFKNNTSCDVTGTVDGLALAHTSGSSTRCLEEKNNNKETKSRKMSHSGRPSSASANTTPTPHAGGGVTSLSELQSYGEKLRNGGEREW